MMHTAHGASTRSSLWAKTWTDPGHGSDLKQNELTGKAQGNEARRNSVSPFFHFLGVFSLAYIHFASKGDGYKVQSA